MAPRLALLTLAALLTASAAPAPRTSLEDAVLAEINFARTHPADYAEKLVVYRSYFEGNRVHFPDNPVLLVTNEGPAAVDEAIRALRAQAPLPPLEASDLLSLAASDLVADQGERGATGHTSADGSGPGERVKKRGGDIYVAETISYGTPTPVDVVRQLLVDDGVPSRGHRTIILSPEYRYAGVGCGPHSRYRGMCVIDYSIKPNGKP